MLIIIIGHEPYKTTLNQNTPAQKFVFRSFPIGGENNVISVLCL